MSQNPRPPVASPGSSRPRPDGESIRRNTGFALGVQFGGALFTGLLTIFLIRSLGPDEFGVFAIAMAIGALLLLPSDFGISHSASRFIAEQRGETRIVGAVIGDAITLKLIASGLTSAFLIALAGPIAAAYDSPGLAWPLRLMAIAVAAQSMMSFYARAFGALNRNSLTFRLSLSESAIETTASIAIVLLGGGATGATAGRTIGFACGAALGLAMALRVVGRGNLRLGHPRSERSRRIAGYAGALLIIEAGWAVFTQIDVLLIGAILGAASAGLFEAPLRMTAFALAPGLAIAAGVAPRLARNPDHPPNVGAFAAGLRLLVIFQMLLLAPVLIWARPLVDLLFGSGYGESADVLRALAPYVLLTGIAPVLSLGANFLGEASRRVPLAIAAVAVNLAIDLILIPRIGIVAGAIGSDLAMLLYVAGHLQIVRQSVGLPVMPLLGTVLRTSLAAAVMAVVLLAFGTDSVSPAALILGGILATAAYLGVIRVSGELTDAEVDAARASLRARMPGLLMRTPRGSSQGPTTPTVRPPEGEPTRAEPAGPTTTVRQFASFLVHHGSCGAGFEVTRVSIGLLRTTCIGCGTSFEYVSRTGDGTSEHGSGSPAGLAAVAGEYLDPPRPPIAAPETSGGRISRAPAEPRARASGRRGRRTYVAAAAILAAIALLALAAHAFRDDETPIESPSHNEQSASPAPGPGQQAQATELRNDLYRLEVPARWRVRSTSDGATSISSPGGGAKLLIFAANQPSLTLEAMAQQAGSALHAELPGARLTPIRSVRLGGSPGLRLTARVDGVLQHRTVISSGPTRYLLIDTLRDNAGPGAETELSSLLDSFAPQPRSSG